MPRKGRIENLKPFPKGQSGNPGGRPKSLLATIEACRPTLSEDLVRFWCRVAFGTEADVKKAYGVRPRIQDRLAAASELADRLHGKAGPTLEAPERTPVAVYVLPEGTRGVKPF